MHKFNKRFYIYLALTLLTMLLIFIFSAQNAAVSAGLSDGFAVTRLGRFLEKILPRIYSSEFKTDIRKYAHMFEYLCLGIFSALMFYEAIRVKRFLPAISAELLCFIYAASDEWHQTFVPGRSGRFQDVLVDSIGFTIGIFIIAIISRIKHKKGV